MLISYNCIYLQNLILIQSFYSTKNTYIGSLNESKANYFQIEFKGKNICPGLIIATELIK